MKLSICLIRLGTFNKFSSLIMGYHGTNIGLNCDSELEDASPFKYLLYYDDVFFPVLNYLIFGIFSMQIHEWLAMIFMIQTQKNRSTQEITYDHNNENIGRSISKKDPKNQTVRRREKILKNAFDT